MSKLHASSAIMSHPWAPSRMKQATWLPVTLSHPDALARGQVLPHPTRAALSAARLHDHISSCSRPPPPTCSLHHHPLAPPPALLPPPLAPIHQPAPRPPVCRPPPPLTLSLPPAIPPPPLTCPLHNHPHSVIRLHGHITPCAIIGDALEADRERAARAMASAGRLAEMGVGWASEDGSSTSEDLGVKQSTEKH